MKNCFVKMKLIGRYLFLLLWIKNGLVASFFVPRFEPFSVRQPWKASALSYIDNLDAVSTGRSAILTLERLKLEGTVFLWNSTILTGNRRATSIDLRLATGIEGG